MGSRLRVGINGFGRIGRAVARVNLKRQLFDLVVINDINPDPHNIAYLFKYDSTYGRLPQEVSIEGKRLVVQEQEPIALHCKDAVEAVPWGEHAVDVVIDGSGVDRNMRALSSVASHGVRHGIVTAAPGKDPGCAYKAVIMGVNEGTVGPQDFLLSTSTCDAGAFVPVVDVLQKEFGIDYGFVTTLHPWLNYQNLLDGPSISISDPGSIYSAYVLGRASTQSLIPKTTSILRASALVMPGIEERFISLSYRVPTMIVSSANLMVNLSRDVAEDEIIEAFESRQRQQTFAVIYNSHEALVSIDFAGSEYSCAIDHRWTAVHRGSHVRLVLWYDNEWGYASRVVDLVSYLGKL